MEIEFENKYTELVNYLSSDINSLEYVHYIDMFLAKIKLLEKENKKLKEEKEEIMAQFNELIDRVLALKSPTVSYAEKCDELRERMRKSEKS
jgi:hypothetical protein